MKNQQMDILPSKPRSGSSEISQKNSSSVISKTVSASKHVKGNPLTSEFNSKSYKSLQRKPSKVTNLPEKRIVRVSEMQQQMGQLEEELKKMNEQLGVTEEERDRALDELREMKKVAEEANMRLSEAMPSQKASEVYTELNAMKESLSSSNQEMKIKEENIESLKRELENAKQLGLKLAEKDASLSKLKEELNNAKTSEARMISLLSESKTKIEELEAEMGKVKESETKALDLLVSQTKQVEQTKISLEESKLEIASLRDKLEGSSGKTSSHLNVSGNTQSMKDAVGDLKSELQLADEKLRRAQEGEKLASLKAESLLQEMELLKNELKLITEAEENSKKALDDLALALKEVATEANQVKEKLSSTQAELEHAKGEAEQLKLNLKSIEAKYKGLLDESKKETELFKNTSERLRLEAEESLLAWNEKEIGFVNCIKRTEEERTSEQQENKRLLESLLEAENTTKAAKEETHKVRDILKQALNEANVAKEAAAIAKEENSQLKDCLADKDDALDFLTRENESLRTNEVAALENIMELKRLLSRAPTKESKTPDMEQGGKSKTQNSTAKEHTDPKKLGKTFSFDRMKLKIPGRSKEIDDEALQDSIFDIIESPQLVVHHRKKSSSAFTDDGETITSEDFDHLDGTHFDDIDNDRNSRKKKALLHRVGDLIMKRSFHSFHSFHRREPSIERPVGEEKSALQ